MAKGHKLTPEQKDEIRRLTQLANRRIKSVQKAYEKEGMKVPPSFLTGGKQIVQQNEAGTYALSRSVKFETEKDYLARLEYLRSFDPKDKKGKAEKRPTLREYQKTQVTKTTQAIENILGSEAFEIMDSLQSKIKKMSAPMMSKFWKVFSDKAKKMGVKYSSNEAMVQTLAEFFPEDFKQFNTVKAEEALTEAFKRDMMGKSS